MKAVFLKFNDFLNKFTEKRYGMMILCFLSGALGAIPYYCEQLFVFTFVSLFALFYLAINQRRAHGRIFLPFFMYFLGFYGPLYLFLAELYPYERFGFSETQAGFIVVCSCILIPLLHATVEALIMLISKKLPDNHLLILGYAALWVIGEWVLTLGTLAFPWGNISVSLTGFLPYLQTISIFGRYFVTFITVGSCAALAFSINYKKRFFAVIGTAVILLNSFVGTIMWFIPTESGSDVKAASIQGNVLSNEKWALDNSTAIFNNYIQLSEEAANNGAEIILLPESAIPFIFKEDGAIHTAFANIAKEYDATIISGINYYEGSGHYNSVIGIMPDGSLSERYDKRHLVPFGEFIPFVDILGKLVPFVGEFSADSGEFAEGSESVVIETEHGEIAPLVCFDSIFSSFAVEGVENGGDVIAVVTNDSWFNDSAGIFTHLRHSQVRAIETGRYVMRAANTGISAFIDEQGRIIHSSEPLVKDIVYSDVSFLTYRTIYTYIGDAFLYLSFAIIFYLIIYNIRRTKNGKNTVAPDRNL